MARWNKDKLWVNVICLLLFTTVLVGCSANTQTIGSSAGTNGTGITGMVSISKGLNIREEPTTTGVVVGNYDDGTMITILEIKDGWGRTEQGWVSLNYVTTMDGTSMADIGQIEISVDGSTPTDIEHELIELNIREKPDITSAVVGVYPNGTIIKILETKDDWGRTDQGWVYMKYVTTVDGNTVVDTSDFQPAVDGSVIITDTKLVQYGTLKMLLPSGIYSTELDGAVMLTKDSVAIGGIRSWNSSEFHPSDIVELKKEESGVPIGYMSGSSAYGDAEYEVFWDGNPEGLNEQHTFFVDGDIIYDVWYDENQISDGIAERFLKTVAINADPVVETVQSSTNDSFDTVEAIVKEFSNAYFVADSDVMKKHLSRTRNIEFTVYESGDPDKVVINAIKGLDNISADIEEKGFCIASVEFKESAESDYYVYLTIQLIQEDGQWKIAYYTLEM